MKFTVSKVALAGVFDEFIKVKAGVDYRLNDIFDTRKICDCRLDFSGSELRLTVFERHVATIERALPVEGSGSWGIDINAIPLRDALKKAGKAVLNVEIGPGDGSLLARAGAASFSLPSIESDIPAKIHELETGKLPSMAAGDLAALIKAVVYAMAGGRGQHSSLKGVYLHTQNNKLIAVALDGFRLSRYAVASPEGFELPDGLIIPNNSIPPLLAFLGGAGLFPVRLWSGDGRFVVTSETGRFQSPLVDGGFPDYQRFLKHGDIGEEHGVDYLRLAKAVELCMPTWDKCTGWLAARKIEGESGLALESSCHAGDAQTFIDYDGPFPDKVCFNPNYMLDALTRKVVIDWGDGFCPIQIQGALDKEYMAVIMPIRV